MKSWLKGGLIILAVFLLIIIGNYLLIKISNETGELAFMPTMIVNAPGILILSLILNILSPVNTPPNWIFIISYIISGGIYFVIGAGIGNLITKLKNKEK